MVFSRRHLLALLASSAVGVRSTEVRATTLAARSLDELVQSADLVILGVPRAHTSHWQSGFIVTDHRVEALTVLRGPSLPAGTVVTVRTPGGIVGDIGQSLEGSPSLVPDRMAVLLLTAPRDGAREVVSLAAGLLPVETPPQGPARVMPALTENIHFTGVPSVQSPTLRVPPQGVPLAEMLAALRAFRT